ncbi:endonuclease, partial [Christensenellaceae bacterium OttesenSCG-928-L17]|nr:endonuclease [Christensenellaceae bacterium OttesenSCG-928-L17]
TELEERTESAAIKTDKLLASVKVTESCMVDLAVLMKHAATYRELKPVYDAYRKSSDKEKFLRGHESDIILFEASARALKEMKIDKLPSAEKMTAEHEALVTDKEKLYAEYKAARQEAREYSTIKQNVDSLLSVPKEQEREKYTER